MTSRGARGGRSHNAVMAVAVAVTGGVRAAVDGSPARSSINSAYLRAAEGAGLVPLAVFPGMPAETVRAILALAGGLMLTGGGDIDPGTYGEAPAGTDMKTVSLERDEMELLALREADAAGLPVLAICRGMQLLNVARGGSLLQDIAGHAQTNDGHRRDALTQEVVLEAGSLLAGCLGSRRIEVNSMHHQAVGRLGAGLVVTGRADDPEGTIEAIQAPGRRYVLGVQWHPEELVGVTEHASRLFASFAAACGVGR